jgi:hypothetical protein
MEARSCKEYPLVIEQYPENFLMKADDIFYGFQQMNAMEVTFIDKRLQAFRRRELCNKPKRMLDFCSLLFRN